MSFVSMMQALIAEAKKLGGTPETVADQIRFNWGDLPPPPVGTKGCDEWGRVRLSNGRYIDAPFPLSEKWDLTEQQIANIRANCCCDALGRWEWTDGDGVLHIEPAAFSGFYSSSQPPEEFKVSMFQATKYEQYTKPDNTTGFNNLGHFKEPTYRTRFTSLEEAEAHEWPV